jgi:hypothetical protein
VRSGFCQCDFGFRQNEPKSALENCFDDICGIGLGRCGLVFHRLFALAVDKSISLIIS